MGNHRPHYYYPFPDQSDDFLDDSLIYSLKPGTDSQERCFQLTESDLEEHFESLADKFIELSNETATFRKAEIAVITLITGKIFFGIYKEALNLIRYHEESFTKAFLKEAMKVSLRRKSTQLHISDMFPFLAIKYGIFMRGAHLQYFLQNRLPRPKVNTTKWVSRSKKRMGFYRFLELFV